MVTIPLTSVYERFVDQVAEHMTPEEILAFHFSDAEQERLNDLIDQNKEAGLTLDEKNELQQLLEIDKMMSLLKAKGAYDLSGK